MEQLGEQCTICFNNMTDETICTTNCNHSYCKQCLDTWFDRGEKSCPICRSDIQYLTHKSENIRIIFNRLQQDNVINISNDNDHNNNNLRMRIIRRSNNLLRRYIYFAGLIISFQIFVSINDSHNLYDCKNSLVICNTNNTYLQGEITNQAIEMADVSNIDVINTYRNIVTTCSFPLYYIHKCFTS